MAVSKKLRFEVFRRDRFRCRYCGRSAEDGAVLEPDHVVPRARGGEDRATNLVTACEACNSGKSDTPIQAKPIPDVPKELLRRACADRGINLYEGEPSLEEQVLRLVGDERDALLDEAKRDLEEIYQMQPTPDQIVAYAAKDAARRSFYDSEQLSEVVERFLLSQSLDEAEDAFRVTRERLASEAGSVEPVPLRQSAFIAEVGAQFLRDRDTELLATLSGDERAEWDRYALALLGEHPWGVDVWNEREVAHQAAYALRVIRAGRFFPIMCRATGDAIESCPRRAEHMLRLGNCGGCKPDGPENHVGHESCGWHLQLILDGKYINHRGEVVTVVDHASLAVTA